MRSKFACAVIVALLGVPQVRAQNGVDPASLMPEKTLAYGEIRQMGKLAQEFAALFKGSVLENVPDSLQPLRAKYDKDLGIARIMPETAGVMGSLLGPEMIAELARMQGAAICFTGVSSKHDPEFLAVVLPGQSNAPAFFMRMMLTMAPTRKLESVEGVVLYRLQTHQAKRMTKGPEPEMPVVETGPVFAMAPGALLIGSHDNVKGAILRLKAKAAGPSLAANATFQEARKQMEEKPGLFGYANVAGLLENLEKASPPRGPEGRRYAFDKESLAEMQKTINPKVIRAVAKSWTLADGKLALRQVVLLDGREKSPLLEVLPSKALDLDLLHFAPKDAVLVAAMSNSDGALRWQKMLALADALDAGAKEEHKPSTGVKMFEKKLGIDLGKEVIGQIANAAFAMGDPMKAPIKTVEEIGPNYRSYHSSAEVPMVILLQAIDEKAAEKLLKLAPTMFARDKVTEPATQSVLGRELYVLPLGRDKVYYGRQGNVLVLGPYAAPVAESLNAGTKRQGFLANPQAAVRLKEVKDRQGVLFMKLGHLIASGGAVMGGTKMKTASASAREPGKKDVEEIKKKEIKVTVKSPLDDPLLKEISSILKQEEFLVLGLRHDSDKIQIDGQVAGLNAIVPQLTDFAVEQAYRWQTQVGTSSTKPSAETAPTKRPAPPK